MTLSIRRRGFLLVALGLVALLAGPQSALAQKLPAYDAKAGMLNVGADPERPDAEIFHVSYTAKGGDPATRPVTFVFNGGPGASSAYLHLAAIGPKTLATTGDGSFPSVPARIEDNPDSWLAFTDLVFIDPMGTGYSRMLPGPDGKPALRASSASGSRSTSAGPRRRRSPARAMPASASRGSRASSPRITAST